MYRHVNSVETHEQNTEGCETHKEKMQGGSVNLFGLRIITVHQTSQYNTVQNAAKFTEEFATVRLSEPLRHLANTSWVIANDAVDYTIGDHAHCV